MKFLLLTYKRIIKKVCQAHNQKYQSEFTIKSCNNFMKGSYILFEFILRCPVRPDFRYKDRRTSPICSDNQRGIQI